MASRDLFRMPKNVPQEVARHIRTASRKIAKPGQVLSYENAFKLHGLLQEYRRTLRSPFTKAARAAERTRTLSVRKQWTREVERLRSEVQRADAALSQLDRAEGVEPLPPLASPDVVPVVEEIEESEEYVLPEEEAAEWEVGVDYIEEEGWHHQKGRTSDVSFNARLFRRDGRLLSEETVRNAMYQFAGSGHMPSDIVVRSVSWTGWTGRRRRDGTIDDLDNFRAILQRVGDRGLRVGAVKRNRL